MVDVVRRSFTGDNYPTDKDSEEGDSVSVYWKEQWKEDDDRES